MADPSFRLPHKNVDSAIFNILMDNNALLKVILLNQTKSIAQKTGKSHEEISKTMKEQFDAFRDDKIAEVYSRFG